MAKRLGDIGQRQLRCSIEAGTEAHLAHICRKGEEMQVRTIRISRRSMLFMCLWVAFFILLSGFNTYHVANTDRPVLNQRFSLSSAVAAEKSAEHSEEAVEKEGDSEKQAEEGESKKEGEGGEEAAGHGEEASKPYPLWLDFCAFIFAFCVIAVAYMLLKRKAEQPPKEQTEQTGH